MTPTTLLLTPDPAYIGTSTGTIASASTGGHQPRPPSPPHKEWPFAREIDEDERGHTFLARLAIRHRSTVYLYCAPVIHRTPGLFGVERFSVDKLMLRIYTDTLPPQERRW